MTEIERRADRPADPATVPELVAKAVTGVDPLLVTTDDEERSARRIVTVLDAIRAAR